MLDFSRRGLGRSSLLAVLSLAGLLAAGVTVAGWGAAKGQLAHPPALPQDASGQTPGSPEPEDPARLQMEKKLELQRNGERQKRLEKDTAQLLALATELKAEVDKTDKNILSVEVVKKAEAIEKLAKSVKERMKNP